MLSSLLSHGWLWKKKSEYLEEITPKMSFILSNHYYQAEKLKFQIETNATWKHKLVEKKFTFSVAVQLKCKIIRQQFEVVKIGNATLGTLLHI